MPYSEQQLAEFKRVYQARYSRQRWVVLPLLLLAIAWIAAVTTTPADQDPGGVPIAYWGVAYAIVIVGCVGFSLWNLRCPACGKYLAGPLKPRYCSNCGVGLR